MNFIKEFEDMVLEESKRQARFSWSPAWAEDVVMQMHRVQNVGDIKCIYVSPVQYDEMKDMLNTCPGKVELSKIVDLQFRGIRVLPSVAANDGPLLGIRFKRG